MKKVSIAQLEKGDKIKFAETDMWETFQGFTDDTSAYGSDPKQVFANWKEVKSHYGISNIKALEELQDKNKYGFCTYIQTVDSDGEEGIVNCYIYNGKFCYGSGGNPASFLKMTPIEKKFQITA